MNQDAVSLSHLASGVRCLCELYPSLYLWKSVSQVYDINMGFCAPISGCRSFLSGNKPRYYMEICCSHAMMQDFNNQWHPSKRFHLIPFYLPVQESIKNLNVSPQTVNYNVTTLSVSLWAAAPTLQNIEGLYFGVHNKHLSWWWSFPVPLLSHRWKHQHRFDLTGLCFPQVSRSPGWIPSSGLPLLVQTRN